MTRFITIALMALTATVFGQETVIPLEENFPQAEEVDIDGTYFHPAASMYIHGDATGASNLVHTGLAQFPDNGKLLRLKELLEKQQEQEQDQNQDQNQDQENQDQQDQQDQNNDQQNQDQQDDQKQDQNEDQQDQPEPEQPEDQNQQQQEPPRAEQMSQDEAARLMDAMKQDEETKRLQLQPVMGAPIKVDKDW